MTPAMEGKSTLGRYLRMIDRHGACREQKVKLASPQMLQPAQAGFQHDNEGDAEADRPVEGKRNLYKEGLA